MTSVIPKTALLHRMIAVCAAFALAFGLCLGLAPGTSHADGYTIDDVKAMIDDLPVDPRDYSAADTDRVNAAVAAYNSLSEADQQTLDNDSTAAGQSHGRVLESAQWAIWSLNAPDNSTTLPDGTYDASTTPALSSWYSKGKSTSPRERPWSVLRVEVRDGRAFAAITVESISYPSMITGGVEYPNAASSGNCVFENVPIDLNGTFYLAGVSSSMPRPIMFSLTTSIDESAAPAQVTVTFTNGQGTVLDTQKIEPGASATPPADPTREGFVFAGWDASFSNVATDTTVNATWIEAGAKTHTVTFTDGQGGVLKTQKVKDGEAATAPADPTRDGFTFIGWNPSSFDSVMEDLTVNATWLSNDQISGEAVHEQIAKLPENPVDLMDDTDNVLVAEAGMAYNMLTSEERSKIPENEQLLLVQSIIMVLPSDPYDVTSATEEPLNRAATAYNTLSSAQRSKLDTTPSYTENVTYGRYLENAQWAFDSLKGVDNSTSLADGTYSKSLFSMSSLGKSTAKHSSTFTLKSIIAKNGKATAVIEHSSNSYQTLHLGNEEYTNLETDPQKHSRFEIPVPLNKTFHFSIKGKSATEATRAISYEMKIVVDEGKLTPDTPEEEGAESSETSGSGSESESGSSGDSSKSTASSGTGGSGSGGTAGNLAALASGSNNKNNSSNSQSSSSSTKSDSAASASNKKDQAKQSASQVREVSMREATTGSSGSGDGDVSPAVAGGIILATTLGVLAFTLGFVRREGTLLMRH